MRGFLHLVRLYDSCSQVLPRVGGHQSRGIDGFRPNSIYSSLYHWRRDFAIPAPNTEARLGLASAPSAPTSGDSKGACSIN
jgi:hypothetical protein